MKPINIKQLLFELQNYMFIENSPLLLKQNFISITPNLKHKSIFTTNTNHTQINIENENKMENIEIKNENENENKMENFENENENKNKMENIENADENEDENKMDIDFKSMLNPIQKIQKKSFSKQNYNDKKQNYNDKKYIPKQKDSLFWCFYILKYGYSKYEFEIRNQYFTVEKSEKYKYIELFRQPNNKALLKLHKIKPFLQIEDELANQPYISIKTFLALCIIENINIMLIDKRKIYEKICIDIDENHPINIIHHDLSKQLYYIELDINDNIIEEYKKKYYILTSPDATLKNINSYKIQELIDFCQLLKIDITNEKKLLKKDLYNLLVQYFT